MSSFRTPGHKVIFAIVLAGFLAAGFTSAQPPDGLPDLIVTGITLAPEFPETNQIVEVLVTVRNIGTIPSSTSRLVLRINETVWSSQKIPSLPVDQAITVSFTWVAAKGRQVLSAQANAFNDIQESNVSNNTLERTVEFTPDLIIESVAFDPANPQPNQTATISIVVRNAGGKPTDENAALRFKVGRTVLGTFFVQPLAAGERARISTRWRAQSGEHVLRFEVDALKSISESDELNNAATDIVNISSTPPTGANLTVRSLRATPARPAPGQSVTISATVQNNGGGVAGAFDVVFEVDGQLLDTSTVPALLPGETTEINTSWIARQGERVVRVKADHVGVIVEPDESDNALASLVEVGSPVNRCTQVVFLELEPDAVPLIAGALGLSDEAAVDAFIPKVKALMERDFEGVNLMFALRPPAAVHSRLRLLAESRFAILGSAPLDVDNSNPSDVGSLFLGSFAELGGGRPWSAFDIDQIAQSIANTASHEVGHLLGLRHDEPGATRQHTDLNLMSPSNEAATFFQDAAFTDQNLAYLKNILPFDCQS